MGLEDRLIKAYEQYQSASKQYDLLIVGNGFDLGCGFKTSYKDFLSYLNKTKTTNGLYLFFNDAKTFEFFGSDEWNSFENLLCQYLQFLDYSFNNKDQNVECWFSDETTDQYGNPLFKSFKWKIKDISKLPNNVFSVLCLFNPLYKLVNISFSENTDTGFYGLIGAALAKELFFTVTVNCKQVCKTKEYVLNKLLKELNKQLLELEKKLQSYIKVATEGATDGPASLAGCTTKTLISFNYSTTAQKLYKVDTRYTAYIHGSIDSDVVLGIEPSMISGQTFGEESDFVRFFKRFRRIYKNCNKDYNKKIFDSLVSKYSRVAIYGHSLDLTDKSILAPIFQKDSWSYDIYCYKEVDSYKLKLEKLIGIDLLEKLEQESRINWIPVKK